MSKGKRGTRNPLSRFGQDENPSYKPCFRKEVGERGGKADGRQAGGAGLTRRAGKFGLSRKPSSVTPPALRIGHPPIYSASSPHEGTWPALFYFAALDIFSKCSQVALFRAWLSPHMAQKRSRGRAFWASLSLRGACNCTVRPHNSQCSLHSLEKKELKSCTRLLR